MRVADLSDALHAWVRMEHERVGRVPVRGEQLLAVRAEENGGNLRWGTQGMKACAGGGVPDVERRVVRAAA